MSRNKWTSEQQRVIDSRGKNLLVSAAAGSGKTAVLVERILQRIMDREHPIDMDHLLVVTFTRAAAGEMRERIGKAIEQALAADPDNVHLQRQSVLIHRAKITTIDGFCNDVVQNYFHRIGIDPAYRIAEEGELKLMQGEVLENVLEQFYEEGDSKFLRFMEAYAPGKTDHTIEELLLRLYSFATSAPYPEEWLDSCLAVYQTDTLEELEQSDWIKAIVKETKLRLEGIRALAVDLSEQAGGVEQYIPYQEAFRSDAELLQSMAASESFEEYREVLKKPSYQRLSSKTSPGDRKELKPLYTEKRDNLKKKVAAIYNDYFSLSMEQVLEELHMLQESAEVLVSLEKAFISAFAVFKRKKNVMDFQDIEHFALEILVSENENGERIRTDAARELASQFEEVMIDEYQDSNYLQEAILTAVTRESENQNNRFMVGDVKQSIYSFRMARPDLFIDKFLSYRREDERDTDAHEPAEPGEGKPAAAEERPDAAEERPNAAEEKPNAAEQKRGEICRERIDLGRNFRSRREVLQAVNAVFERIMIPEIGNVTYDEAAALYPGAVYLEPEENEDAFTAECIVLSKQELEDTGIPEDIDSDIALEALAVANRIKELMKHGRVQETGADGTPSFRTVHYRDIVILLRSAGAVADTFVKTLQAEGIPAFATSREGYFSAVEVMTVLNYLRIIDNPQQDIPFTSVLHSPIVGCTDQELARIRVQSPKNSMCDAVQYYAETEKDSLAKKLQNFLDQLHDFRSCVPYTEVHQLIYDILERTSYRKIAAAMPAGKQREANLQMLMEKAVDYEKTSYHGLFHFIRYIEQLEKYQVDYGEVSVFGESEDAVRIMTIHKSKGLEFPIVFVSALGRQFNMRDAQGAFALQTEMGIGFNFVDLEHRTRYASTYKKAIQKRLRRDSLGEELRVLYVAMTRAREKLILTGVTGDEDLMSRAWGLQQQNDRMTNNGADIERRMRAALPFETIYSAKCYLQWILSAMPESATIRMKQVGSEDLISGPLIEELDTHRAIALLRERMQDADAVDEPNVRAVLQAVQQFKYPYRESALLPAKMTVSEIKMAGMDAPEQEPGWEPFLQVDETEPIVPKFIRGGAEVVVGAARGTIYHHVFQCLDYIKLASDDPAEQRSAIEADIERMKQTGLLDETDAEVIRISDFVDFLQTDVGRRMRDAAHRGTLRREQPFVLDVPANTIDISWSVEENILVQGTIDAYFEENGQYILVDYKTDLVQEKTGLDLVEKYHRQLDYYAMALEQITGVPVAEKWIYSVTLGRAIACREDEK